jgi:cysteinyl-tRNA synthetase
MLHRAQEELRMGSGITSGAWIQVQASMMDDLNTPAAIATLSEPLKTMNELLIVRKKKKVCGPTSIADQRLPNCDTATIQEALLQVQNRIQQLAAYVALLEAAARIFGIATEEPDLLLQQLRALALERAQLTEEDIAQAIVDRAEARKAKDFARADGIRDDFSKKGINFQDSPSGTTWRPSVLE